MHENETVVSEIEGLLAMEEGEAPPERKQPQQAQEQPEAPAAEPEEDAPREPEVEAKAEEAEQPETKTEEPEEQTEEQVVQSISDLAEHLGVEVADLYKVTLPVNTPEGRKDITIGEWKDAYQQSQQSQAKATQAAQQAEEARLQIEEQSKRFGERLMELDALASIDEKQLETEAQKVNWDDLRANDPAEFAARRQEFIERQNAIQGRRAHFAQVHQQHQQAQQAHLQTQRQEILAREQAALEESIPEWRDGKVAETEKAELVTYMQGRGYRPEEISTLADHRAVTLLRKAMLYDKQQKSKPEVKKVVKIGTKVLKPGSPRSKQQVETDGYKSDLRKFRKSGGRDENLAVDLVEKHLLGEL